MSAGLTLLPARRKGKERAHMVSVTFYGARGGVPGQNSIGHSHWMKCIISKFQRQKPFPCRVLTEGQGQWAKLCCRLISDSIIRLFYFTPRCLVGVTPCTRKAQKELYKRRQQQIGDKDVSFIFFLYFLGSTIIRRVREFTLNIIEMVESPS